MERQYSTQFVPVELDKHGPEMQYLGRAFFTVDSFFFFFCYQKGNFSSKVFLKEETKVSYFSEEIHDIME